MSFPAPGHRPIQLSLPYLVLFLLTISLGAPLLGALITGVFFGGSLTELSHEDKQSATYLALSAQFLIMYLALRFILMRPAGLTWMDLGVYGFRDASWKMKAVGIGLLCVPLAGITNLIVQLFLGEIENPQLETLAPAGFAWSSFIAAMLMTAVIAPILEELIFRGFLYRYLRERMPVQAAMWVSALIFASLHMIPELIPALVMVGYLLAYAYERSQTVIAPIIAHGVFNAVMTAITFGFLASGMEIPGAG